MGLFDFFKSEKKSTRQIIIEKFYSDYPEIPYVSEERGCEWIEIATGFPIQSIIPKQIMTRYNDGLLPGHIYMLYWLKIHSEKSIPLYFEYQYGINFEKEKEFLRENGYLSNLDKPTGEGMLAIENHFDVIENHMIPNQYKQKLTTKRDENGCQKSSKKQQLLRSAFEDYDLSANIVKSKWSIIYNLKCYKGERADELEDLCLQNINAYKKLYKLEEKYKINHITVIEGSKRLAMLYEKQGRYEEAISVCKEACFYGVNERNRMARMIKKANRQPTPEENEIIGNS